MHPKTDAQKGLSMLDALRALARSAGRVIMDYSATLGPISLKEDRSPLTGADLAADALIRAALAKRFPEIPVLSEEGEAIPYRVRRNWNRFWLIDPLDGTKEFIAGNGEFTVNIALVAGQRPVLGVVCVPAQDRVYYGMAGAAFMQQGTTPPHPIRVRLRPPAEGLTVVVSRSHPSPGLEDYLQPLRVARVVAVGSSLKLCMVAAGTADLYPGSGRPSSCRSTY